MIRWLVLLLLLSPRFALAEAEFTVERLWQLSRLGPFAVAPDGRSVAVGATSFDIEADKGASKIWLFDIAGDRAVRQLTAAPGSDSQPAWHPDGRQLFFLGTRQDKPAQLYRIAADGGEAEALTDLPVAVQRYRVVEGGRALIFEATTWPDLNDDFAKVKTRLAERKADKTQAKISETRILRYWDHYLTDGQVPHLFRLDLATRTITDLLPGFDRVTGFEGFEWDASADGRRIVYSANATVAPYRELNFDLYLRELSDGRERNLTADNPADDVMPLFAPAGARIAYGRYARPAIGSDFRRLAVLDLDSGQARVVADNLAGHAADWCFAADGERLYFHSEAQGRSHLYQWQQGRIRRLASGGVTEKVQVAGRGLVYSRQDFTAPPDLWYLDPGQKARRFTGLNEQRMRALRGPRYDSVDYRGNDGAELQMFVAYPPGWRRGARYPAIVLSHGGPFGAWTDSFSFRWHPGLFAARGYVVALPNFRGSTGFGQAFADAILGNHGEKPAADTVAAADWLIANAGADPQRLALAGGSYGGYLTALLTGMSDRFKVAIVHAGVYDIAQQFASDSHWSRPSAYGDAPWTDPVRLGAWSPSRFVPRMRTPTLILHGEMDYRVPVSQGINLHGALTGKGVPTRIVVFPQEHHHIVRPQAAALWWTEVFAWLARWNRADAGPARTPAQ